MSSGCLMFVGVYIEPKNNSTFKVSGLPLFLSGHLGQVRSQQLCGRMLPAIAAPRGVAGTWKLLGESRKCFWFHPTKYLQRVWSFRVTVWMMSELSGFAVDLWGERAVCEFIQSMLDAKTAWVNCTPNCLFLYLFAPQGVIEMWKSDGSCLEGPERTKKVESSQ